MTRDSSWVLDRRDLYSDDCHYSPMSGSLIHLVEKRPSTSTWKIQTEDVPKCDECRALIAEQIVEAMTA